MIRDGWQPLVQGAEAERARAALAAITADLLARDPGSAASGPFLAGGAAGLALFFHYLAQAGAGDEAADRAERHLARAVDDLLAGTPAPSLFQGFVGVAWVAAHLAPAAPGAREAAPAADPADDSDLDAALLHLAGRAPGPDLTDGIVGWGVYALERPRRGPAAGLLGRIRERLAAGPPAALDLGMAHGVAGWIALLARCRAEAPGGPGLERALAAAVAAAHGRLAGDPSPDSDRGELAWCAGEAGLAAALLAAARAAGRADWGDEALALARAAAGRTPADAPVADAGLCHGAAGLAHLFHRLYRATGDPVFAGAARRWLARTLDLRRPGEGVGGYLRRGRGPDGEPAWIPDPGFLTGAAGIGLALLAALTPLAPAWDRLLLLSGRAAPGDRR